MSELERFCTEALRRYWENMPAEVGAELNFKLLLKSWELPEGVEMNWYHDTIDQMQRNMIAKTWLHWANIKHAKRWRKKKYVVGDYTLSVWGLT